MITPHCGSLERMADFIDAQIEKLQAIKNDFTPAMEHCKKLFPNGDNHYVKHNTKGYWEMSFTNDHPLQHGEGKSQFVHRDEFIKPTTKQLQPPHLTT